MVMDVLVDGVGRGVAGEGCEVEGFSTDLEGRLGRKGSAIKRVGKGLGIRTFVLCGTLWDSGQDITQFGTRLAKFGLRCF